MKLSDAIVKFNSWQSFAKREGTRASYRVHLMHFALYMRNCDANSVTLTNVMEYLEGMREIGWNQNSFMVKCIAFRKFFEFLSKLKEAILEYELIPIVERDYHMPKVAKLEDYYKVLAAIKENNDPRHIRNKLMLMMFKDTGVRLGELLSLNLNDLKIDKEQSYAIVKTEKTKKLHPIRKVFWTPETQDQLDKWLLKRKHLSTIINGVDSEALFISVCGIKTGRRLRKNGATEVMRRLSHEAGLTYVLNSHQLRHLFGHDLAKKKFPSTTISTMLGHATPVSSYVYTMLNGDEMGEVYKELRAPVDK